MAQPFQLLVSPLLSVLSVGYGLLVRVRLWLYSHGWFTSFHLPCPVLSVGNITVGGTGKTPTTLWFAQQLMNAGLRVGILSRGYRRTSRARFVLVSNGRNLLVDPSEAGDEPFLLAKRCPGVIVAVGADRYRLGEWVLGQVSVDCFVLDDGFQHVKLHRDVDVALIDSRDFQGHQWLLPRGRLREPLNSLARATTIVATRCDNSPNVELQRLTHEVVDNRSLKVVITRFGVEGVVERGMERMYPPNYLSGKAVVIFSGVANPVSFRQTVEALGVVVVEEIVFQDHYAYAPRDVNDIVRKGAVSQAQCYLTTEKDLVKIKETWSFPHQLYAVRIGLQVDDGAEGLEGCVQTIVNRCRNVTRSQLVSDELTV